MALVMSRAKMTVTRMATNLGAKMEPNGRPIVARARHTDPFTSHLAASTIMDATTLQIRIVQCFDASTGMTDEELIATYSRMWGNSFPATESSIRSRRAELRDRGAVVDTGRTRPNSNGNKSIIWDIEGRLL